MLVMSIVQAALMSKKSLVWISMGWHWFLDTSVVLAIGWLGREGMIGIWVAEAIVALNVVVAVFVIRRIKRDWDDRS